MLNVISFINWLPFPSEIPELSLCLPRLTFLPSFLSADPSVIIKLFLYYKQYICCLYRGIYKTLLYTDIDVWSLLVPCVSCRVTLAEYGPCCIWDSIWNSTKMSNVFAFCVSSKKFLYSRHCSINSIYIYHWEILLKLYYLAMIAYLRNKMHKYSNQCSCTSNKRNVLPHSDHTSYIEFNYFLLWTFSPLLIWQFCTVITQYII